MSSTTLAGDGMRLATAISFRILAAPKQSIPFAQWRHLSGDRRFTFLKDAKPTCYGTWNLKPGEKVFVVEGASDAAVLQACFIPWVALPSAASSELMKAMAAFCRGEGIEVVYAGDNDDAGDKLKDALHEVMPYRVKQPPKKYKDWGDFYVAEGSEAVSAYCRTEFAAVMPDLIDQVLKITGGTLLPDDHQINPDAPYISADEVRNISPKAGSIKSKEQSTKPAVLF
jgi:hypothetical protein